jgi:quinohemoprotein ethanol dehydrogenase
VPANGERRALVAWDPATQQERWRAPEGGSIGGGTVTTAGNLVFQVTNDGKLLAYSADKGEKLFEIKTDLGGGMGPPITYQLDGKQYVTLAGGTGKVAPRYQDVPGEAPAPATGPNAPPDLAGPNAPSATPAAAPRLLTFVLDGKAQ